MKLLRRFLDDQQKHFSNTGKLKRFKPFYNAVDTFLYTTDEITQTAPHIRDSLNLKRLMITVVLALVPALFMGLYNTGYQANLFLSHATSQITLGWRLKLLHTLGIAIDPANLLANFFHGALYFLPIYITTLVAGGFWEILFAVVRKHDPAEGFVVTSLLFALILPPTIPLWLVAIGISFGVVIGKEIFGGVGMNILNPALTGRVFLFFAYPIHLTGDSVWVAVDGVSQATLLTTPETILNQTSSWWQAFVGLVPGSIGETSTLACLAGAFLLIITGIASWRIMIVAVAGMASLSLLFNLFISSSNLLFAIPPHWHLVLGGFAFGSIFMATDPVSAPMTNKGKYFYGLLIGILVVLIRVINPAFPEGTMLAILFANVFAPIMDRFVVNANINRRQNRCGQ